MLVLTQVSSMKTSRRGIDPTLMGLPARPLAGDVGPHLLGRPHGFF